MQIQNSKYFIFFFIIVVMFNCLTYFHDALKMPFDSDFCDFGAYYFYSSLMRDDHNIYELTPEKEEQLAKDIEMPEFIHGSANPPFLQLLIIPFTFMKYKLAASVWFILNNILFLTSIAIIFTLVKERISFDVLLIGALFIVFNFQPLIENVWLGNFNIPILFVLVTSLVSLKKNRPVLAGIFIALAVMFKHQFGLLLLFFLWKREYLVFLSAFFTIFILEGLTILFTGLPMHLSYLNTLNAILSKGGHAFHLNNLSVNGALYRLFNIIKHRTKFNLALVATIVFNFSMLVCTAYITRGKRRLSEALFWLEFPLIIVLILIICPIVHEPHYVLLYIPILLFWYEMKIFEKEKSPWILFIISYLLIGLGYSLIRFPLFHKGILSLLYNGKLYGVFLLYLLGVKLINRLKHQAISK